MATFQPFRNSHVKPRGSVRKSFSEDVFQSVKSLLQSEKELCSISGEDCLKQDEHASLTEVTFLGFNEETDAARIQDLAAVSLELPDLLNSLHFCSLNENEIICMKDINKSSDVNSGPLNQSHHSGMLCVMRVSPTLPRLRIDFIFSLLSKYATGIRYTLDTYLHQNCQLETTHEDDDDDTNQSVSSIEDDFVTAFEQLEEEEASKPYSDGINSTTLRSQCDMASQTICGHHLETHDLKILVSSGQQKSLAKPLSLLINVLGHEESHSVKNSVTTSISEPWVQRSFYRSSNASDKSSDAQKTFFSSSPAYSSESECSSPSPVIFLDEEGYQKSLKAKLELPKIPVMKDDVEDSDSEVSEFFDSFDQFDELEQSSETFCLFINDPVEGKSSRKKGHKHEKSCMNPQKFKSDCPALPANVKKPTPRKPESPYSSNLCDAPDSPRPVKASGDDSGWFSPIRSSAFSPLGSCTPAECFCQTDNGGYQTSDSVYYIYDDYANNISCEVLESVLHNQHANEMVNINSIKKGENKTVAFKHANLYQKSDYKNKSLMIKDNIQRFAADLVEKSFSSAFKDLQKGVSSCTNALCHLAIKLTSSVFQMAFNELRRQHAFSLKQRAISGLANFLVSEAFSHALKDLQYVKKQIFTNTVAKFAADLAEELVFEGIMEVCQFSYPSTPASVQCQSFDFEDKVMKSYAEDLSESVIQEAFIELSQVDVPFTTKAAVSVSTDNIKYVNAESVAPSTQTFTISPFNNQAVTVTKPVQEYKKEYTVQQALFCTSGIVTSIPVPLAGSALLPYHISFTVCHTNSHLSLDDSNTNGDSTQAHVMSKSKEEEVGCPRNICLPSEHNLVNQNDCKPPNNDIEIQSSSKLTSDPVIISNFSAAMVHTIVNETLESMTLFKVAKTVDENTECLTKTIKGHASPFSHQAAPQQGEATNKDTFAELFSKSVIKDSIDTSKSIISTTNTNTLSKEGLPVAGEESQSTSEKFPKFLDAQNHLPCCSLSMRKDCVPERKDSMVHGISLETLSPCPMMASQKPDLKELAKDKPVKKHNLNDTALEPLSFGQESPLRHSHTISSTVLTCVDGLHVEDKQKIRDRNIIPDTPPSTPLVPSQASSEWDIKKLTKKLKGELAKEFAPATPPSTPHNSSVGSLSESEHNTIEKEEFMLKLMRSLSEEVESSEGEEHPEMNVKLEHSGKKVQFAEALATHIISFATEMAASHLDHKITQEPEAQKPCFSVQSQGRVLPVFLSHSDENFQTRIFAGDMAAEIITEAEKIAKARSSVLHRKKKNLCFIDGDQDYRSEEKLDMEVVAHPREVDPFIFSLPPSSMSGLTYKYPSCESVTDEYAGHVIQLLKQEGGNGELIMDQFANRLAYRSVKSGLQEAAKTAKMKYSSKIFPMQSAQVKINSELLMFSNKEQHREVGKKSKRKRNGGHLCQNQTCERTRDTCRNEDSHLYSFSASLARCITRDVKKELMAPKVDLPKSLTDSCLFEKSGYVEDTECLTEPEFSTPLQLSSQNQGYHHSAGNLNRRACGENIVQALEQYAKKVVDDTLELGRGSKLFQSSETTKPVDRITYAEKLSPLTNQNCRYCDLKELHDCTGNSTQHFFRQDSRVSSKLVTNSKFSNICQKSRIFHLDVPQIHVNLDKKSLLAEKIVAEAIERAERELSNTSLAADSGIGQDGISFAESLTTEIMTSAMLNVGHTVSSSKDIEDAQSTESLGSQQMNLSIGEDSIGSWSNLSFEDEHQDESSSFHHLSESSNGNSSSWSSLGLEGDLYEDNLSFPTSDSDEPDDKDEEHEDDVEGLEQDGKTLLITNIDMEPCTVDPQLRIILQWLISSEAEVTELYFHDSSKKDFILLSKRLQEKGWKVGDLLQAVLKYYEVVEKASSEERCKSLFDWLLENA